MSDLIPFLGVAFVAFSIWLAVRIINRRERWAKRTAVVLIDRRIRRDKWVIEHRDKLWSLFDGPGPDKDVPE
jgi:hypothetical protein